MAKKIHLNKADTLKDIVEQIVNSESDDITLTIPNFSKLVESESNFKVLKKLGEATEKKISIESVDEKVIKLAKDINIEATNPFFENNKPRTWKDIEGGIFNGEEIEGKAHTVVSKSKRFRFRKKYWFSFAALIIFTFPTFWIAFNVLPRADIQIITQKSDWSFNDLITVGKDQSVPAQVISQKKNAQMAFPATGKKVINKKASGKITVYNAYSSEPQRLVATTRFITKEGKIFRLAKDLIVPGAKITNGQIMASSIEVEVVADKSGPEYNVGPESDLKIPGFKETPKYAGFYGEIKEPMRGGFSGSMAYPTDADIKNSQTKISQVLEEALNAQLITQLPVGVKLTEGSKKFVLLNTDVDPEVNQNGEFSILAEGEIVAIGFKEKDLLTFVTDKMKNEKGQEFTFKNYETQYGIAKADFKSEQINLPVDFKGIVERPIDINDLRKKIAGKSEIDLKTTIFALPGLASASVALWPFYVSSIPDDVNPVNVKIEVK